MKLAIVRQRYTPYGGAERFVARALPALERAGADVTLIARNSEGWEARRLLKVDPFYVGNVWRDWSFARAARRAWSREGFALVQSHERIPGCDVYRAGDGVHRRWLEIRRRGAGLGSRLGLALNPYHWYVCRAERAMFRHPRLRAVICNSRMVQEEIRRHFDVPAEKLHLVYSGVDLEHFHPRERAALRAGTRARLGLAPDETAFLFAGSGFARKGLGIAIAALARSAAPRVRLLVAGRDRSEARFRREAERAGVAARVIFLGAQRDMRPLYAAADCLLLPTRYDPFPNVALEALAMGLPAIVSSRCGAAEVLAPGENGWICDPDDADALARLLGEAERALRSADLGASARRVAERFGLDAMAARLSGLYAALLGARA